MLICDIGKNFIEKENDDLKTRLERAKDLIYKAKMSGADVAKFQVHNVEDEIYPNIKIISPHFNKNRKDWVKDNTYDEEFWFQLSKYAQEVGIEFMATPMSKCAAELINDIGVDRWKIGSADILDFVMLDFIRDTGKPVIISSGMSSIEELRKSYNYLKEKIKDISILHCVSLYPCPLDKINLKTITYLQKEFPNAKIGFSDHTSGIETALIAKTLGAEIIEKHMTFNYNAFGPDHKVSILPQELLLLSEKLLSNELIEPNNEVLGVESKWIQQDEMEFRKVFRKGLYASRDLKAGQIFEPDDFYAMRPKLELAKPSENYPEFIGKVILQDYKKYDII